MGVKYDPLLGALRTTDTSGSGGGGDLHYETTFTTATSVTVDHNLNKKPAVTILDSAGDEVEGDLDYTTNNQVVISFSAAFSGTVICN